ncbi:cx9C motif-containing protein 4, mitochondrial [Diaphorina citri]|uniref:Cx9C motif-containing protein 4, mitochondrial n=1 Tax=Diaphorina citri TaxID=121845 RepID=A0A1S3DSG0_DIACI|nr:cx9C motif-containing protein 4, mitochondrial [Diaphorina citri]KAI5745858.1 hypothetical protein M8J76_014811 [Diaphorina citri]
MFYFDDNTMNVKQSKKQEIDPCKRQVCDLQKCLSVQNYQEDRCKHCLTHLCSCCQKFGDKSFVCSGMKSLVKDHVENRKSEDLERRQSDVSPPSRKGLITNLTETIQKSAQNVISTLYKTEGDSQVD